MVHRSPSITTFHKAESSKLYFNRAFWDNVISILQQHTRNDVSTLPPGSTDYTTSFKPVTSSDWILMPFCTGWHNLMRKLSFPDFNSIHWHFLVHWALIPPGAYLGAEYSWQTGLSSTPPHRSKFNSSSQFPHPLQHLQAGHVQTLTDVTFVWERSFLKEAIYGTALQKILISSACYDQISYLLYLYTIVSPSLPPSKINPTMIYSCRGYCLFPITPFFLQEEMRKLPAGWMEY